MGEGNKNNTSRWIIALCITVVIAVIGWTTTVNLSMRVRALERISEELSSLQHVVAVNSGRISVLESEYNMIQTRLTEIKALLERIRG